MIDFKKLKEQMENNDKTVSLTVNRWKWDTAGQSVFGKVKAINDYHSETYDKIQKEYIIDTGEGLISVFLNDTVDRQLSNFKLLDSFVLIKYQGKEDLANGKKFKKFDIKMLESEEVN